MSKYTAPVTVRLSPEVYEQIMSIAASCETSCGSVIRQAISKFLKEYK